MSLVPPSKVNNVFIAAFITTYARLDGEAPFETGEYLGQLTGEMAAFKNLLPQVQIYAYQTRRGKKTVLPAKGITHTQENGEKVNFDCKRFGGGVVGG